MDGKKGGNSDWLQVRRFFNMWLGKLKQKVGQKMPPWLLKGSRNWEMVDFFTVRAWILEITLSWKSTWFPLGTWKEVVVVVVFFFFASVPSDFPARQQQPPTMWPRTTGRIHPKYVWSDSMFGKTRCDFRLKSPDFGGFLPNPTKKHANSWWPHNHFPGGFEWKGPKDGSLIRWKQWMQEKQALQPFYI